MPDIPSKLICGIRLPPEDFFKSLFLQASNTCLHRDKLNCYR